MIILIKNENEIRYKITLGRVEIEKGIELGLEEFGRDGFGGGFFDFLFFLFFENFIF